jgi:hypothetical protein
MQRLAAPAAQAVQAVQAAPHPAQAQQNPHVLAPVPDGGKPSNEF